MPAGFGSVRARDGQTFRQQPHGTPQRPERAFSALEVFGQVAEDVRHADSLNVRNGGTSLVAAAEDQLGLKFEPGRELLDVLVIDGVKMPTPD